MNLVTMTEDVVPHLGVPVTGLMPEMHTGFQHLAHRDSTHEKLLIKFGLMPPHTPCYDL
jgi:hypothetical protein